MSVRTAAIVAGVTYLLNPVSYAEFYIYPKLIIPGHVDQTVLNIGAHTGLFAGAILCYLASFIGDVILAWSLYVLLAPVNRALSLLASWFQLVYAGIAIVAVDNLVAVYHLVGTPDYLTAFGAGPLDAQVLLSLHAFRYGWQMGLVLFGIHLVLVGCLIVRSDYIPWIVGVLLVINGLGWMLDSLGPYLLPNANLEFTFYTFFGEIVFMFWLLIRGWKVRLSGREAAND
jgi:hypothetical protein